MTGKWLGLGLAAVFIIFGLSAWPEIRSTLQNNQSTPSADNAGYQHGQVKFAEQTVKVLIPTTQATQAKGLGGRTALSDSEGMLWQYAELQQPTFWMKDMLIHLDFIWLRDSVVVEIMPDVAAPENATDLPLYTPTVLVDGVLEVPAGFALRHHVQVGDAAEVSLE
jgi:uncharacterized membrane protein (UPF0127 family)